MSNDGTAIRESDLQAFVDDRLPPKRRAAVESYLAVHPDEAARLQAYREQGAALHALFDPVLGEDTPPVMLQRVRRTPWRRVAVHGATALVYLVLGGVTGWWLHGIPVPDTEIPTFPVEQAANAHAVYTPEVLHPVEVTSEQEAHLVKWLSKRLGAPVQAPSLARLGYRLVGGRLLPAPSGAAAQFMFENQQGLRLTLYVVKNADVGGDTAFRFAQHGDIRLFYWIDGPLGYALVGEVERANLLDIANAVYHAINR